MYIMLNYIIVQTRLRHKTGIVTAFEQMDQFVDDDVFQAFRRFFCEFQIQPNAGSAGIATAPKGFHFFHAETLGGINFAAAR